MLTYSQYEEIIANSGVFYTIYPDGQIQRCMFICNSPELSIVSGSFNPLHIGHKRLYYKATFGGNAYFEISISRVEKPVYSFEEIQKIIKQFAWYAPVIITNARSFSDKSKLFNLNVKTWWHVGFDTAQRIIRDYSPEDLLRLNLFFRVYERNDNTYTDLSNLDKYRFNIYPGFEDKGLYDTLARSESSTAIRKALIANDPSST